MVSTNTRSSSPVKSDKMTFNTPPPATFGLLSDEEGLCRIQKVVASAQTSANQPVIHFSLPSMARTCSINSRCSIDILQDLYHGSSGLPSPEITDYHSFRSFHYGESIAESISISDLSEAQRSPEPGSANDHDQTGQDHFRAPTPYPHWLSDDTEHAPNPERAFIPQVDTTDAQPHLQAASIFDIESCRTQSDTALKVLCAYHIITRIVPGLLALCICGGGFFLVCVHVDGLLSQSEAGVALSISDLVWAVAGFLTVVCGVLVFLVHLYEVVRQRRVWQLDHYLQPRRVIMTPVDTARMSTISAEPKEIELNEMAGQPESAPDLDVEQDISGIRFLATNPSRIAPPGNDPAQMGLQAQLLLRNLSAPSMSRSAIDISVYSNSAAVER